MKLIRKVFPWIRDALLFAAIIYGITLWQSRNMLDDDGSVTIAPINLVSLQQSSEPLFEPNKRTLIYFFAPWCTICESSINNLDYLDDDTLHVVRVALDYDSKEEVVKFVQDNNVKGKVLFGTEALKKHFNIPGYPTYYLLNEQRQVVGKSFGYSTAWGLKLKNLLNK